MLQLYGREHEALTAAAESARLEPGTDWTVGSLDDSETGHDPPAVWACWGPRGEEIAMTMEARPAYMIRVRVFVHSDEETTRFVHSDEETTR